MKISPTIAYHAQPLRSGIIEKIYVEEGQILFEIAPTIGDKVKLIDAQLSLNEAKSNLKLNLLKNSLN